MLSVLRVHLPSDIPIAGCELSPYVLLKKPDNSVTPDDVPESHPVDGFYVRYRWYRIQNDKRVAVCSVHPSEPATLQCLGCLKAKLPASKSYHCSSQCFAATWRHHKAMHARPASGHGGGTGPNGEEEELFGRFGSGHVAGGGGGGGAPGAPPPLSSLVPSGAPLGQSLNALANGAASFVGGGGGKDGNDGAGGGPLGGQQQANGDMWYEVGRGKTYTPTSDDVGHVLKLECAAVDASTGKAVAPPSALLTSRVIPAPSPTPRRVFPFSSLDGGPAGGGPHENGGGGGGGPGGTFTVLSYNVLADLYASSEVYSYCPPWALSWAYRRQNLLRELVGYRADILCLQEVQSDHYEEFFAPELEKHGYAAVYKKKTGEVYTGTSYAIDGCATFYRRDRFSLVKKYEVEFNKAALSLSEALLSSSRKAALNRLLKDNVALIVVLEAKDALDSSDAHMAGKRQLLCVANTHIHANPELKDVKLWQVHTLLKGLEKIAASADIPMLVAGDFNSVPGSAPHSLLATGRVDAAHPELATDPLGILRPAAKLCHQLPLVSAYATLGRAAGNATGAAAELHRRRMDAGTSEPLFTNCTRDFLGTLDYIFYTADSLAVEGLLELLDEDSLRKDTALPSPEWSSDHIALLAEFRYKPRVRR